MYAYDYRGPQGGISALQGAPVSLSYSVAGNVASGMVQALSTAPQGSYYFDCAAQGGSFITYFQVAVSIVSSGPPADFSLSPISQSVIVTKGGAAFSFQAAVGGEHEQPQLERQLYFDRDSAGLAVRGQCVGHAGHVFDASRDGDGHGYGLFDCGGRVEFAID